MAQDIMVDAPGVRELKVEHGFQAHGEKLAGTWTDDLTADIVVRATDVILPWKS